MINLIVSGVNISGQMAGSQRIKNLIWPLLDNEKLIISNLIFNEEKIDKYFDKILVKVLKYQIFNPFSVISFLLKSILFSYKKYDRKAVNIIYQYGYPSIENIVFIKASKLIGYKIVFDIVEIVRYFDQSRSNRRMRIKNISSRLLINQLFKSGSICFAISTELVAFCSSICKNRIPVVHLPISVDIEFVNSFKKEANIKHNSIRLKVFYGGSFGDKDGIIFLLRGFEMACESNSNIELILTGKISNQMNGIVQRLIAESQWNMRIKYLGCIPTEEYFETMVNSDILCMTRINTTFAKSGFPFKLGEYLASGNAIISTDVGDVSKYIVNRHNAILINPGSEVEICDAIILLCQDSQLRTRIGIAGKETASKYFSTNLVSDILWKNLLQLK